MRVSRRLSGFYKPALLIGSLLAIIYLVNDSRSDLSDKSPKSNVRASQLFNLHVVGISNFG